MTAEANSEPTQMAEAAAHHEEPTEAAEEPKTVFEESKEPKLEAEEEKPDPSSGPAALFEKRSSSFKEESNFLSDLKDHERKALIELRSKLEDAILNNKVFNNKEEKTKNGEKAKDPKTDDVVEDEDALESVTQKHSLWGVPLNPSDGSEKTDVVLLKFLRAREFNTKDALEMLEKTLQWRKDYEIGSVFDEDLGADLDAACYLDGVDREGHPVCYNVWGVFEDGGLYRKVFGTKEGREKFLRWRVRLMEEGIKKLDFTPGGATSLLQITDLKNSPGPSKRELRNTMKQVVQLLQDNYPEFVAKNIFINVPFWYYAFYSLLSPFLTQRTRSKMVIARPGKVTETLLKYIPAEAIPLHYGSLKRENDTEFSTEDGVSELIVKASSTEAIEIPAPVVGSKLVWDLIVLGWEVNYKEEFVPNDEGSYTVIIQKGKKMGPQEEPARNSFTSNEPGKVLLMIENGTSKKKKVLFRYKSSSS